MVYYQNYSFPNGHTVVVFIEYPIFKVAFIFNTKFLPANH